MGGLWAGLPKPVRWFFSGFVGVGSPLYDKTINKQDAKINAITYTQCTYGAVINLVYGTNKLAGNVIDYNDFIATAHTETQSGKGGGVTTTNSTTFTYSARFLIGLCQGAINGIGRVWKDTGSQTTLANEGFNVFGGYSTQNAWGDMVSLHPSKARKYRNLAYVAGNLNLGTNATLSNYTFEVYGKFSNIAKLRTAIEYTQFSSNTTLGTVTYVPEFSNYYSSTTNITIIYVGTDNISHTVSNFTNYSIISVPATTINPAYIYYSLNLTSLNAISASIKITYKYTTQLDANPASIVYDILTNDIYGAGYPTSNVDSFTNFYNYCNVNGLLYSPIYSAQDATNSVISTLVNASNSEFVNTQGILKIIPLGDSSITKDGTTWTPDLTPIYDITDDDYLFEDGDEPITCTRSIQADVYNSVTVEFVNRSKSYSVEIAQSQDLAHIQAYGLRVADTISAHFATTTTAAKRIAQLALDRNVSFRNTYTFKLSVRFILLDPLDLITISNKELGLDRELVRIIKITEVDDSLEFTVQEMCVGSAEPAEYEIQAATRESRNINTPAGNSNSPVFIEPPFSLTNNDLQLWIGTSGEDTLWGGANIWISDDGESYRMIGNVTQPCRQGYITNELPVSTSPDITNTLSVDLTESRSSLLSGTQADADNLNTLCWVNGELISYETATLTDTYKYDLSYLIRGALNTTVGDHSIGENFVRVDNGVFLSYSFLESDINRIFYVKAQSFNVYGGGLQALEDVTAYEYTIKGAALPNNPDDVVYFTVAQNLNLVQFNWQTVSGDTIAYEIREGESWEKSSLVVTGITGTTYSTTLTTVGTHKYWISAINTKYSLYSTVPKEYILYVDNLYQLNILINEKLLVSNGTFSNCYLYNNKLKLNNNTIATWQDNTVWNSSGSRYYANSKGLWGYDGFVSSGVYVTPSTSIGNILKSVVTLKYNLFTSDNNQSLLIEWRYSTDNVTFTDWQVFQQGLYKFKYFQIRFTLNNPTNNFMYLDNPILQVDVPDRSMQYANLIITNASSGVSVVFDDPFTVLPSVVGTSSDGGIANIAVTKTVNGANAKVYNSSGVAITGTIDLHVQGY